MNKMYGHRLAQNDTSFDGALSALQAHANRVEKPAEVKSKFLAHDGLTDVQRLNADNIITKGVAIPCTLGQGTIKDLKELILGETKSKIGKNKKEWTNEEILRRGFMPIMVGERPASLMDNERITCLFRGGFEEDATVENADWTNLGDDEDIIGFRIKQTSFTQATKAVAAGTTNYIPVSLLSFDGLPAGLEASDIIDAVTKNGKVISNILASNVNWKAPDNSFKVVGYKKVASMDEKYPTGPFINIEDDAPDLCISTLMKVRYYDGSIDVCHYDDVYWLEVNGYAVVKEVTWVSSYGLNPISLGVIVDNKVISDETLIFGRYKDGEVIEDLAMYFNWKDVEKFALRLI